MARRGLGVAAALGAGLVLACSAYAATGTLTGSITGAPGEVSSELVEAVNPQGVIGGVAAVSSSGAYSMHLGPGTWIVAGSAQSGENTLSTFTPPAPVRAGRKTHGHKAHLKAAASKAPARGLPSGSVVTFAPIIVDDERGPIFNLKLDYTAVVTNDLFKHCASRGIVFVDTSDEFQKFAQQEQALSHSGHLSTPFNYQPIKPQSRVETEFNGVNRAGIEFGLGVHKLNDPQTPILGLVAEGRVSRNGIELESQPSDEEVLALVNKEAEALAEKMCG